MNAQPFITEMQLKLLPLTLQKYRGLFCTEIVQKQVAYLNKQWMIIVMSWMTLEDVTWLTHPGSQLYSHPARGGEKNVKRLLGKEVCM